MKYMMFEHAGSGNHGCEAIVRSTTSMLGNQDYYLESINPDEDIKYGINSVTNIVQANSNCVSQNSLRGFYWRIQGKFNRSLDFDDRERLYRYRNLLMKDSLALSIGGDNYCYAGIIGSMRDKLKAFRMKNIPTVLWGCSVDRTYLDDATINDLKKYSLITARESLTMQVLQEVGITGSVMQCSDPAFTLQREYVNWHRDIFDTNKVIGINVSDFMKYYNAYPDATYRNFVCLIDYLIKETDYLIALIPHVRQSGNDDIIPINKIAAHFNSKRILVINEDFNCMQLKDVIARCCMFIGCRTHATIAAYSTCVPTLVVGYSIKAKGICKDIFGKYDGLLVDVRKFVDDTDLLKIFLLFFERQNEFRKHLEKKMPEYIQQAYLGREALFNLI